MIRGKSCVVYTLPRCGLGLCSRIQEAACWVKHRLAIEVTWQRSWFVLMVVVQEVGYPVCDARPADDMPTLLLRWAVTR
jgi:hypothetical protein